MHYLIKDTVFENILEILNQIKGIHKRKRVKLRQFIEAVHYICRTGCQWRLLPYYYGNWRAVHKRFKEWSIRNIWEKLFKNSQVDADFEWIMIDSTIVRSHACSAGYGKNSQEKEALGRSRGGFTTKVHAVVDALGNPLKFILTPGQKHDITQAENLTAGVNNSTCIADKGYDANKFIESLKNNCCEAVIPSKRNRIQPREYDKDLYKERHQVECFLGKIKHYRRVFSRFDKSASSYLSFLHLVGALIWFR